MNLMEWARLRVTVQDAAVLRAAGRYLGSDG
jgi:hypothetical protein